LLSRVNNPKVVQLQILQGNEHGTAPTWSIRILELKPKPSAFSHHQQVELGTGAISLKIGMSRDDFQGRSALLQKCTWRWSKTCDRCLLVSGIGFVNGGRTPHQFL
jgi:hypothetical protein